MNNLLYISKVENSEFEIMTVEITEKQNTERMKNINRKEVLRKFHLSLLYHKLNTQCEWRSINNKRIRKKCFEENTTLKSQNLRKKICVYEIKFKSHMIKKKDT